MAELFHQHVQAGILGRAVDAAPAALFVTDGEGRFVAANRYACQMLGRERAELLSLRLADVVWGPDPLPALDQGTAVGIAQLRDSEGNKVVVRFQVRALNGGDSPFAVWLATTRHVTPASKLEDRSTRARDHDTLSARELEILQLIADGLENEAIARELFISTETVKSHVRRILQKLGAHSRTYAVAVALRRAMVD